MVENLAANAGDMRLIPGPGRSLPHAMEQLSLCAATTEARVPQLLQPVRHSY